MHTLIYTLLALLAFAGNSVLCRLALANNLIEPVYFTQIRLLSGAVCLLLIALYFATTKPAPSLLTAGSWRGALALFVYALFFSLAYVSLDTATGALVLFSVVQFTLITLYLRAGHTMTARQWMSVLLAMSGLFVLLLPGVSNPSPLGIGLMAISGAAWGLYTHLGTHSRQPLADTAANFMRTLPLCLLLLFLPQAQTWATQEGVIFAILSGALASGGGYALWYYVLPRLTGLQAGLSQLTVPLLAALAGFALLGEAISWQLLLSGLLILTGIALLQYSRQG